MKKGIRNFPADCHGICIFPECFSGAIAANPDPRSEHPALFQASVTVAEYRQHRRRWDFYDPGEPANDRTHV